MRVVVTGGNGKLGRFVVRDLRDHGHDVLSVDARLPADPEPGIRHRQVEMADLGQVVGALAGADAVVHLAAIPRPFSHPDEAVFRNNVGATYHALHAAMVLGIRRAVIASSVSAYGMAWAQPSFPPLYAPVDEAHPFLAKDPYALSKEVDERTAEMFARRCGMTVLACRFHWIAEPGEARRVALDPAATPDQNANNLWGYLDARDAARAVRLGLAADIDGFVPVNLAAADTLRPEPTEQLIRQVLPGLHLRRPLPDRASGWAIDRARERLGWEPQHSWQDPD